MPPALDVSVVIPTCDRPLLAVRAVRSVLAQTHPVREVIVVIDGPEGALINGALINGALIKGALINGAPASSDPPQISTIQALAELGDPRVRPIVLPERRRAPNARNVGAQQARGHWTALLDDDDEWLPDKIAVQLEQAATARAPLPIVASRLINRTPRADSIMPRRLPAPGEPLSEYFTVRRGLFYGDGFIQTSTIMAPTELLRRVPFTVGLRRQQELDWTLRAIREDDTELVYAAEPLVLWHQDENRHRISLENPYAEQLEWLRANRDLFTPRAYAAFTLSVLSSMAAPGRRVTHFRELLAEARRNGRPAALDYLTHAQIWALPPTVRRRIRDLIVSRPSRTAAATNTTTTTTATGTGSTAPTEAADAR